MYRNVSIALSLFLLVSAAIWLTFPDGINRHFALHSTWYSAGALAAIVVFQLLNTTRSKQIFELVMKQHPPADAHLRFRVGELVLPLLPTATVVQYCVINADLLTKSDMSVLILTSYATGTLLIVILPLALRKILARPVAMALMLSLSLLYVYTPILAREFSWVDTGDLWIQSLAAAGLFALLLYLIVYWKLFLYWYIPLHLAANTLLQVDQHYSSERPPQPTQGPATSDMSFRHTPDIYLLTYDAYVENATMLSYGIDNREQEAYLEGRGFKLYRGTYSKSRESVLSMGTMLDWIAGPASDSSVDQLKRSTAGFNPVNDILKNNGYQTYNVTHPLFFPKDRSSNYDFAYGIDNAMPQNYVILAKALALGEFKFDIEHFGFERGSEPVEAIKETIFQADPEAPKFLYTHSGPGHSQNSGRCRATEVRDFVRRLNQFNEIMQGDIESILAAQRDAIVIVHGDHGPYLKGDCAGMRSAGAGDITRHILQDRYGTFLAVRWPNRAPEHDIGITTLQDVFPIVFDYLVGGESLPAPRPSTRSEPLHGVYIEAGKVFNGPNHGEMLFDGIKPEIHTDTSHWSDQAESGWGLSITRLPDVLFATIYTYDADGNPVWYYAPACLLSADSCEGNLYRIRNRARHDPSNRVARSADPIGQVRFDYTTPSTIMMRYTIGGVRGSKHIERAIFDQTPEGSVIVGLWRDPQQLWRLAVVHQGETIVVTVSTHTASGEPTWYLVSNCRPMENGCSGELHRVIGGSELTTPWNESGKTTKVVGAIELSFSNTKHALLAFTIGGAAGKVTLVRQGLLELMRGW